ncbi:MAG: carbohydrate binding family 9 domain-containing protein, partial [Candidatus Lokiarchaeia archaeon]
MRKRFEPFILLSLFILSLSTGVWGNEVRKTSAVKIAAAINLDGDLSDEAWKKIEPITGFIQFEPRHGQPSTLKTEVKIAYDDKLVYFAFYCVDPDPENISASITKRDGDFLQDDAAGVMLDTFNDNRTCYLFATNTLGTQFDGKVADNGRSQDISWDAAWQSAAKRVEDGWTAEIAIPFSILKFKSGKGRVWGFNIGRVYPRTRETSFWVGPLEDPYRVSQFGKLVDLELHSGGR